MVVVDFEAEYVSREAFMFAPIYRVRLTTEQAEKLIEELVEQLKEE